MDKQKHYNINDIDNFKNTTISIIFDKNLKIIKNIYGILLNSNSFNSFLNTDDYNFIIEGVKKYNSIIINDIEYKFKYFIEGVLNE